MFDWVLNTLSHCVKSAQIRSFSEPYILRSFSGPYIPVFSSNTEKYGQEKLFGHFLRSDLFTIPY